MCPSAMYPSRRMFRQERLDAIVRQLQEEGCVTVAGLSDDLGVSAVTIRADLATLERAGRLARTHGGAVPVPLGDGALSFSVRQSERMEAKERIGAAAAELVSDGEAIVLDSSTTAWQVARHLLCRRDLTVLTTGLYVALELLRAPGIAVFMPGGPVWREAAAFVGPWDGDLLREVNLGRGFFGGRGLTVAEGLTDPHRGEAELKRRLAAAVHEVNVIVDATKLGKVSLAPCAAVEEIDRVITDRDAAEDVVAELRALGIEVVLA